VISYPAPAMSQGDDQRLLLKIGNIVFPNGFEQRQNENCLRIWVEASPDEHPEAGSKALANFQVVLGLLRAWHNEAGKLADEERRGLGPGAVCDEQGNQYIFLSSVLIYHPEPDLTPLAQAAHRGIRTSSYLQNSLLLNGRQNRTSADYYMIHEYSKMELGGTKRVAEALGISTKAQGRLTDSANNLSPLLGGRHAKNRPTVPLDLTKQGEIVGRLLRSWVELH
jgi:hypothetical protein